MKLRPHPQSDPSVPMAIAAGVQRSGDSLTFSFSLSAAGETVRLPPAAAPARSDGLWQASCFEAFIRGDGGRYAELNFSPSGQWAAYRFDAHRSGMQDLEVPQVPQIVLERELGQLRLSASVRLPQEFMRPGVAYALSAVVEELDGTKSYWALAHSEGPPDFHHPDCFAARLP